MWDDLWEDKYILTKNIKVPEGIKDKTFLPVEEIFICMKNTYKTFFDRYDLSPKISQKLI